MNVEKKIKYLTIDEVNKKNVDLVGLVKLSGGGIYLLKAVSDGKLAKEEESNYDAMVNGYKLVYKEIPDIFCVEGDISKIIEDKANWIKTYPVALFNEKKDDYLSPKYDSLNDLAKQQ